MARRASCSDHGPLVFRGDDGDNQLVDGFHAHGTFEGWCEAIRPLRNYPRVQLAIYAALCAPMLEVLDTSNFILSYDGATTGGKTTCLRVAVSLAGCPDEEEPVGRDQHVGRITGVD